jgi:hypothetical protein
MADVNFPDFTTQLDPKNILGPDLYNATQTDEGKAFANGMGALGAALVSGNQAAADAAVEATIGTLAGIANPFLGVVVGSALGLASQFAAKGSTASNTVCPQGANKVGLTPAAEIATWVRPWAGSDWVNDANGNAVLIDRVGTFTGWMTKLIAAEPKTDPFLIALAGAMAYNAGKAANCYSDVWDGGKLYAIFLATWNAQNANGKLATVSRTLRTVNRIHDPSQGFDKVTAGPVPADWDAFDRQVGDWSTGPGTNIPVDQDTGDVLPVISWASFIRQLWEWQQRQQGKSTDAPGPLMAGVIKIADAPPVSIQVRGYAPPKPTTVHMKLMKPPAKVNTALFTKVGTNAPVVIAPVPHWKLPAWAGTAGGAALGLFAIGGPVGLVAGVTVGFGVDWLRQHWPPWKK